MKKDELKTKDIMEASFLDASGAELVRLEPNAKGEVYFVFKDKSECENLAGRYWSGKAVVNARGFSRALRDYKELIFRNK